MADDKQPVTPDSPPLQQPESRHVGPQDLESVVRQTTRLTQSAETSDDHSEVKEEAQEAEEEAPATGCVRTAPQEPVPRDLIPRICNTEEANLQTYIAQRQQDLTDHRAMFMAYHGSHEQKYEEFAVAVDLIADYLLSQMFQSETSRGRLDLLTHGQSQCQQQSRSDLWCHVGIRLCTLLIERSRRAESPDPQPMPTHPSPPRWTTRDLLLDLNLPSLQGSEPPSGKDEKTPDQENRDEGEGEESPPQASGCQSPRGRKRKNHDADDDPDEPPSAEPGTPVSG